MLPLDRLLQWWRINKARPAIAAGDRVLDIGCADGELFRCIPGIKDGIGVDPDLPHPSVRLPNATLIQGFFPDALPDARPFDVITLLAVLEHVPPERQRLLAEQIARHLKPDGRLIITVPSPSVDGILSVLRFLRLIHGMALEQHYGFDPRQTPALFEVGGMELVRASSFQWQLNHLFVFRKNAKSPRGCSPRAGFAVAGATS